MILEKSNEGEYLLWKRELQKELSKLLTKDIGYMDQRILTGILTPKVLKLDDVKDVEEFKEDKQKFAKVIR